MTAKESLKTVKQWVEYITRIDYVEPIVRNEVKQALLDAYHKTTPEFEIIEKELQALEIIKNKRVNVARLLNVYKYGYTVLIYNELIINKGLWEYTLTQAEFDLLKEVLLDGKKDETNGGESNG